jgi:hypothetical protein
LILVVEQPAYLPWLGYFDLMRQSEVWVWYDDVQYTSRDWRNRNRVARDTEPLWLTVPVVKGSRRRLIADVAVDGSRAWRRKQLETVRHCYGSAPGYGVVAELLCSHFARTHDRLADLVIELGESIAALLGIGPRFQRSSQIADVVGRKSHRLVSLCRATGASTYLSGPAAKAYLDPALFARAAIEVRYIAYDMRDYPRGGQPWLPRLSIIDALAWVGVSGTRELLAASPRWETAEGSRATA